jgi:putative NIF3 family GTP cyclohydrolase 1 type 2
MGGSGRDYIEQAAAIADAYVTADCRYHDFQLAEKLGLTLIDAGHFPTENVVIEPLMQTVAKAFPALTLHRAEHDDVIRIF